MTNLLKALVELVVLILVLIYGPRVGCWVLRKISKKISTCRSNAANRADPSRTSAYLPCFDADPSTQPEDIERRLDELDDALTWHRRRQARADAIRAGFWASVPMAMIALWWSLRNQFASLPDPGGDVMHDVLSGLRNDVLVAFGLLWLSTQTAAGVMDHESGAMVKKYATERVELRAQLRAPRDTAPTTTSSETDS